VILHTANKSRCRSWPSITKRMLILAALTVSSTSHAQQAASFREGQLLVKPRAGLSDVELTRAVRFAGGRVVNRIKGLDVRRISVPTQAEQRVRQALANNPRIAFAELDELLEPVEAPSDPYYDSAWHLAKIGIEAAWVNGQGAQITVAIVDSGIDDSHPDLAGKVVNGYNSVSGSSATSDVAGHGTQVAGVVAAVTDNGLGVASIARAADLMPIRVTDRSDGYAYFSDIAEGLIWAADNGARVANISYDVGSSSTVSNAAQYMKDRGGVVFHAAGNSGTENGYVSRDSHIAVGATDRDDLKASFSSTGQYLDISAPGVGIWSTSRGGGFGAVSGTSFSSPAAAAVAALVLSVAPGLNPDEVEATLESTAVDLGATGWDKSYGHGRIDAAAAVDLATRISTENDTTPPISMITAPTGGASVSGIVPVDITATDDFGVTRVELYVNDILVAIDSNAPFALAWDSVGHSGSATLHAKAIDSSANEALSSNVSVTVVSDDLEPPVVQLTQPTDGATVSGNVSLAANATDSGSGVSEVRISVDGALRCAGSPSVQCSWNSRKADQGTHTITVVAVDRAGNSASNSVSVLLGSGSDGGGSKGGGKKK
jgi:thermitase